MDHVLGLATKGISRGIAISSEAIAGRKQKKDAATTTQEYNPEEPGVYVDREWALDDAVRAVQEKGNVPAENPLLGASVEAITAKFLETHKPSRPVESVPRHLSLNVIIPQRRPRDRGRGFVRAYAPVLDEYGITPDMFLDFMVCFEQASKSSPIFDVINIACFGVGMVPSTICIAVSATVGVVNQAAQELQRRYRSNKFLDEVNEAIFKPRGLYAMIMTYKPDMPDEGILRVDTSSDATSAALTKMLSSGDGSAKIKEKLRRIRMSAGVTNQQTIPDCAPLIYPSLELAVQSNQLDKPSRFQNPVVQDYLDRRAQAQFLLENPNGSLSQTMPPQKKQFVNRFADPDHPVNAGSIFALVTGGNWDPVAQGRVRRAEMKAMRTGEPPLSDVEKHDAYMGRKVRGRVTGTPSKDIPIIGKMLKKDVLYLTIVNLPTEAELHQTIHELESD